jgi:DNA-binding IclR family transcriptional regulator
MNTATQDLRKPVVAVQRAVQILRYLGSAQRPAGVNEVSRALGIVPSTCQHILKTLDHDGLVSEDKVAKKYQLGPTLLRFARDMVGSNDFVRNAQVVLDPLAATHQVTTAAIWREGTDRIIVVAKANAPVNFSLHVNIGSRFPALTSAIGHCFTAASGLDPDYLRAPFDELHWQNQPDFEAWKDDVAFARENGYAVDAGYYIGGITVVAAPVHDPAHEPMHEAAGGCSRALVALGLSAQLKGPALTSLALDLKTKAAALSESYSASVL